jgi:hypothetical protein
VNSDGKAQGGSFSRTGAGPSITTFSGNLSSGNGHLTVDKFGPPPLKCSGQSALLMVATAPDRRHVAAADRSHADATRYTPKGRTRRAGSHNPHAQSYSWTPSDSPPLQIAAREEAKALLVRGLARMETVDGVPDEYVALACGC